MLQRTFSYWICATRDVDTNTKTENVQDTPWLWLLNKDSQNRIDSRLEEVHSSASSVGESEDGSTFSARQLDPEINSEISIYSTSVDFRGSISRLDLQERSAAGMYS